MLEKCVVCKEVIKKCILTNKERNSHNSLAPNLMHAKCSRIHLTLARNDVWIVRFPQIDVTHASFYMHQVTMC